MKFFLVEDTVACCESCFCTNRTDKAAFIELENKDQEICCFICGKYIEKKSRKGEKKVLQILCPVAFDEHGNCLAVYDSFDDEIDVKAGGINRKTDEIFVIRFDETSDIERRIVHVLESLLCVDLEQTDFSVGFVHYKVVR